MLLLGIVLLIVILVVWIGFEKLVEGGVNTVFEAVSRVWTKSTGDATDDGGRSKYVVRSEGDLED